MTEDPTLTQRHKRARAWWTQWRRRHSSQISRVGWTLFGGGLAAVLVLAGVRQVLEWFNFQYSAQVFEIGGQAAAWAMGGGVVCGLLTLSDEEQTALSKPTSSRLQEVMARFEGLDVLIKELAHEVQEMTESSAELEKRAREADALLRLSREEKDALIHEWDRRDRSSSKRDLLLFAAGLVAGVLTNLLIPSIG